MRFKKSASLKNLKRLMRWKKSPRFTGTIGAAAIGTVGVCVAAAAMFIAARQPAQSANMVAAEPTAEAVARTEAPTAASSKVPAHQPVAATIAGCLERDDETFRLKHTTGADAPKSRSWKSGFLKKSSASIEVVDVANRLRLSNHVGQRVSVTGMLGDRQLQVRSLERVAGSCD
jgi:phosphate-selective porin